jgi:hypothetical protein
MGTVAISENTSKQLAELSTHSERCKGRSEVEAIGSVSIIHAKF